MTIKETQEEIINNRIRRGFASATDLSRTTLGLAEEVGEFEQARKRDNHTDMVDALGDVMVYCLGGLEILGEDAMDVLGKIVDNNKTRTHTGSH